MSLRGAAPEWEPCSTCQGRIAPADRDAPRHARLVNAHAAAECTPSLLGALDFVQGDGVTYVQLEDGGEDDGTIADDVETPTLDPTETGWLPTV